MSFETALEGRSKKNTVPRSKKNTDYDSELYENHKEIKIIQVGKWATNAHFLYLCFIPFHKLGEKPNKTKLQTTQISKC